MKYTKLHLNIDTFINEAATTPIQKIVKLLNMNKQRGASDNEHNVALQKAKTIIDENNIKRSDLSYYIDAEILNTIFGKEQAKKMKYDFLKEYNHKTLGKILVDDTFKLFDALLQSRSFVVNNYYGNYPIRIINNKKIDDIHPSWFELGDKAICRTFFFDENNSTENLLGGVSIEKIHENTFLLNSQLLENNYGYTHILYIYSKEKIANYI